MLDIQTELSNAKLSIDWKGPEHVRREKHTTTTKTIKCHFFHFDVFISILIGSQATLLTTYWCLDCWRFIFTAGTGTGLGGRMRFFSGSWSRMTPESAVH